MSHTIKDGDQKLLQWDLGRDLTGVTTTVVIAAKVGATPVISRAGEIVGDPVDGTVSLQLEADDYGEEKLQPDVTYLVEVRTTQDGKPLTHPDGGYETLTVLHQLG